MLLYGFTATYRTSIVSIKGFITRFTCTHDIYFNTYPYPIIINTSPRIHKKYKYILMLFHMWMDEVYNGLENWFAYDINKQMWRRIETV